MPRPEQSTKLGPETDFPIDPGFSSLLGGQGGGEIGQKRQSLACFPQNGRAVGRALDGHAYLAAANFILVQLVSVIVDAMDADHGHRLEFSRFIRFTRFRIVGWMHERSGLDQGSAVERISLLFIDTPYSQT